MRDLLKLLVFKISTFYWKQLDQKSIREFETHFKKFNEKIREQKRSCGFPLETNICLFVCSTHINIFWLLVLAFFETLLYKYMVSEKQRLRRESEILFVVSGFVQNEKCCQLLWYSNLAYEQVLYEMWVGGFYITNLWYIRVFFFHVFLFLFYLFYFYFFHLFLLVGG